MTGDNSETELAFTLLTNRANIERHRLFNNLEPTSKHLISTYFDTSHRLLGAMRWSLRIRNIDNQRFEQTIKGPTVGSRRPEWNFTLSDNLINWEHLRTTPLWALLKNFEHDLRPIFDTEVDRTIYNLSIDAASIEVAIDEGWVRSTEGGLTTAINDLELELKDGPISALYRIAIELAMTQSVMMQPVSKAFRGYQLFNGGSHPEAQKHDHVALMPDINAADCFRSIVHNIIDHMRLNLPAAYAGEMDGIHQVRVSLRRMRAAFLFYKKYLNSETVQLLDRRIRDFSQVFGTARDWDVFISQTLYRLPDTGWISLLRQAAVTKQFAAHAAVRQEIESSAFNSVILCLMGWVERSEGMIIAQSMQRPAIELIPALLDKAADKVDARLHVKDDAGLHKLRKSAKKLRYAVEFVADLFPPKSVKQMLKPCKQAQEILGQHNDIVVAQRLLNDLVIDQPALAPAVGDLLVSLKQDDTKGDMTKAIRQLKKARRFWTV